MAQERHTAAFVVGIALGGLAGAGYVLFTTPRPGKELRAEIAARVQGIVDTVKETAGVVGVETRRAGEQTVERIEATGAAVRDRLPGASGVGDLVPGPNRENREAPNPSSAPEPGVALAPDPIPVDPAAPLAPVGAGSFAALGAAGFVPADPGLDPDGATGPEQPPAPHHPGGVAVSVSHPAADEPARTGN